MSGPQQQVLIFSQFAYLGILHDRLQMYPATLSDNVAKVSLLAGGGHPF